LLDEAPSVGRRRFVRWLGIGGLVGAFAGVLGSLAVHDVRAQAAAPPTPPAPDSAPPGPSDEARALHGVLVGRYGAHLDAAQSEALLGSLEQTVKSGQALRSEKLGNAVEPDTVFRAVPPSRTGDGDAGGRR
jgi:hypothetical protein